jgi:Protein of unknown function (DUF2510)
MRDPSPGWYPNPSGAPGQRYWNGQQWTIVKRPSSAGKTLLIVGGVVFALVGGCTVLAALGGSNHDSKPSSSQSTAAAAGPRSKVADITLPAGAVNILTTKPNVELWSVTTPYDFTVRSLPEQLPIGRDYQGLKWCSQEVTDMHTEWDWGDSKDMLDITVSTVGSVAVDRGPGLVTKGQEGCR